MKPEPDGLNLAQTLSQPMQYPGRVLEDILQTPAMQRALSMMSQDANKGMQILNDPRNAWIGTNPLGQAAQTGLGLLGPMLGQIAYHGSPHKFTKFSLGKIGTGEGAQAFGHGLYFAENPAVAKSYAIPRKETYKIGSLQFDYDANKIASDPLGLASFQFDRLSKHGKTRTEIAEWLRQNADQMIDPRASRKAAGILDSDKALLPVSKVSNATLYKVDLPESAIAKMLDWDKPLDQQDQIQKSLKPLLDEISEFVKPGKHEGGWILFYEGEPIGGTKVFGSLREANDFLHHPTGGQLHTILDTVLGKEQMSARLRDLGISGIKYLDQGSRETGKGTYNYVVFDETLPKILERR